MNDSLAFDIAKRRVREVQDVMEQHKEAMECLDCEAFIQLLIDAYEWSIRADENSRAAIYRGECEYNVELDNVQRDLFRAWLEVSSTFAERWIARQRERGFVLGNVERYQECCRQVKAIVRSFDEDSQMTPQMKALEEDAVNEHRNGETAEFV